MLGLQSGRLLLGGALLLVHPGLAAGRAQEPAATSSVKDRPGPGAGAPGATTTEFAMSPAVAVVRVDGLERYTPLPDAALTSSDKLKVYFRPLHFKHEADLKQKSPYRARFVEDGKIRRKGEKTVVAKEDRLLEYETRFDAPDYQIFLVNTIGLENIPPGDYEFDITLHDMIDGSAVARQSLPFKIVPGPATAAVAPSPPASVPTPPVATKTKKPGRSAKRPG